PKEEPLDDLDVLFAKFRKGDYIAIQAFIDPTEENADDLQRARVALRDRFGVATTVGFGPRYLHSTGQLHKGGPNTGVFIQVVDPPADDLAIPGQSFTFATLIAAQSAGDLESLRSRGRRVARVRMADLEGA